jgi:large subunit ribosomal protein L5
MPTTTANIVPRFKTRYEDEIRPALQKQFKFTSVMQVPRLEKITLNMGVGDAKQDSNMLDRALDQLATIAGQKPSVRRARKSIANFKLREEMPVGVAVTLRDARMYEFFDRLLSVAIPRIRDFRGLNPRSFDGRGNYSMGVREQIIFAEIDYDSIDQVRGLDITITTSAKTDEEAFALLLAFGMPFTREGRPGDESAAERRREQEEQERLEAARQKAEAEQAALDALKEENPEAYEKPAPEPEGDEAAEGADGGGADADKAPTET